ncbi:pyrimidine pathway regulatory protein 1 [Naviculisporaceae sp. PSN 640]
MVGASSSPQSRQQPGCACEQCRKRKLRCDRQRPQCGTCAEAGIVCEVNTNRQARGPKKGDLKALRSRIVALERRLSLDLGAESLSINNGHDQTNSGALHLSIDSAPERNVAQIASPYESTPGAWENEIQVKQIPITPPQHTMGLPVYRFPPSPPSPPSRILIDDLMRADLYVIPLVRASQLHTIILTSLHRDMLYFDRVHPNVPIFNQSRYLARSRQIVETGHPNHQVCLQYAMWTLAMALSSQFDSYRDLLYGQTKQMLEDFEAIEEERDMETVPIEHVQAWLLITLYEFTRTNFRRGWISAGRAFRLVQLAHLHGVDSPDGIPHSQGDDPILIEERRRTFWVAYCLDRFISFNKGHWPLTLTEEETCTRLPSPEMAFQAGHPVQGCFLAEAIASSDHSLLSPLAESAVMATICGRANSHCHVSRAERRYGCPPMEFWLRHEWLEVMLTRRLECLKASYPVLSASAATDPMMLFVFMTAQATVLNLSNTAMEASMQGGAALNHMDPKLVMNESKKRALHAAKEITDLVSAHEQSGYFKAHIFLSSAIYLSASCLRIAQNHHLPTINEVGLEVGLNEAIGLTSVFQVTGSGAGSGADAGGGDRAAACEQQQPYEPALRSCLSALRKMQSFNNLARSHLTILESGDFSVD